MSSDDILLASLSSSSSDLNSSKQPPSQQNLTHTPNNEVEPDWVRDYTPRKSDDQDKRRALLAYLDADDDDDSVIDLLSPTPPDEEARAESTEDSKRDEDKPGTTRATATAARRTKGGKPRSQLPLVVAPRLDESLVLLQSEGTELDLSGDVGAVGRVKVEGGQVYMDLKGVVYQGLVGECNSMCVVSVGEEEARVTAVLDEVVTLRRERDLLASGEIVVNGELNEEGNGGEEREGEERREEGAERGRKRKKGLESGGKGRGKGRAKGVESVMMDGAKSARKQK